MTPAFKTHISPKICLPAMMPVGLAISALGAPVVHKNVYAPATVVLEDFSGVTNPSTVLNRTTFVSISGGAAIYNYAASEGPEGYVTFNPLAASFDSPLYKSMRLRMAVNRDSAATTTIQIYPSPVGPAGVVSNSTFSGTVLEETSFDLSTTSTNGLGVRIDPFNYTNDLTDDQCQIDYIMADLGPTIGFEFNHDGDFNHAELENISSESVASGVLSGTASTGEPNIRVTGGGGASSTIDPNVYKFVEIRMKGVAGDIPQVLWKAGSRVELTPAVALEESTVTADGEWHTYLIDFSNEADWTGTLTDFRLAPVNETGRTFEVDYIRFMNVRGPEAPVVLFHDDFDDTVSGSLTDPAGRATGTIANLPKYAWTATTDVVVDGKLNWDGNGNKNVNNEQTGTAVESLRFGSAANSGNFNWFPYVGGKIWELEYDTLTGNSHPLALGLSDTPQNGAWNPWDIAAYDFGLGNYGAALRYDTDNDAATNVTNVANVFPTRPAVYRIRIRFNEIADKATIYVNGARKAETTTLDFENNARYITFGEPGNYAGYIDNLKVSVISTDLPDPFATLAPLELLANGNQFQLANALNGNNGQYNIAGTFGDFAPFWGSSAEVVGWTPYHEDPAGLIAHIGTPGANDGGVPVLDGTFYLDTLFHQSQDKFILNSSNNYRNGLIQQDILNGVEVNAEANYQLMVDVSQNTTTNQSEATFTAALTKGVASTSPATAVTGSLISVAAASVPTASGIAFQSATISGGDLLAAQSNGPVNVIFEHVNAKAIANYPVSPNPNNDSQVSQLSISSLSLTAASPANDLNKDGVVDAADVALANLYLAGDGGETAEARQLALTGQGLTPVQALAYLNLTDFDTNADGTFNAADVAALQALLTNTDQLVVIDSAQLVGDQFVLQVSDLTVGRQYHLMRGTDLIGFDVQVDSVTADSTSATLTDPNPPVGKAFYRVAN